MLCSACMMKMRVLVRRFLRESLDQSSGVKATNGIYSVRCRKSKRAENLDIEMTSAAAARERDDWVLVCTFSRLILVRRFSLYGRCHSLILFWIPLKLYPMYLLADMDLIQCTEADEMDIAMALPPRNEIFTIATQEALQYSLVSFMHLPRTKYSEDPDYMTNMTMPDMVLERRILRCGSKIQSKRLLKLLKRWHGVPLLPARGGSHRRY